MSVALAAGLPGGALALGQSTPVPTVTVLSQQDYCSVTASGTASSPAMTGTVEVRDKITGKTLDTEPVGLTYTSIFDVPKTVPLSNAPWGVAVGDFNGDHKLDVAVTSPGMNTISILLGNGDGTLGTPLTFEFDDVGNFIAVADVNGDGKVDVLVTGAGSVSGLSVLLGNGDGTFQSPFAISSSGGPFAVGDLNLDGKLDIAQMTDSNTVSILFGKGDGTFVASVDHPNPSGSTPIVIADLNGDGYPDIATVGPGSSINLLFQNGDGTFSNSSASTWSNSGTLAVADLNGDGTPDLIVDPHGGLYMLGNGRGTFKAAALKARNVPVEVSVVVGDFDGDGQADILYSDGSVYSDGETFAYFSLPSGGTSLVAMGDFNGDGRPDAVIADLSHSRISISLGGGLNTASRLKDPITVPGNTPNHVLACFYSGDANYAASGSADFDVTLPLQTPPVFSPPGGVVQTPFSASMSSGFYTTNGSTPTLQSTPYTNPILVTGAETIKGISWEPNTYPSAVGSVTYSPQVWTPVLPASQVAINQFTVTATDSTPGAILYYTLDGSTPAPSSQKYTGPFVLNATATVTMMGVSPGFANSLTVSATYTVQSVVPTPTISLASGRYKGPQTVTITESQSGATIYYTTNSFEPTTSSGIYSGPFTISADATVKALAAKTGSINSGVASAVYTINNTTTTLAVTGSDPYQVACRVQGPGAFSTAGPTGEVTFSDATTGTTLGTATLGTSVTGTSFKIVDTWRGSSHDGFPFEVAYGDVNGDGKLDAIVRDSFDRTLAVRLGNGDGTFREARSIPLPEGTSFVVGDFNGDGKADVAILGSGMSAVAISNGDGTFMQLPVQISPLSWLRMAAADVNGDGKLDLIVAGGSNPAVFLGNGDGTFQSPISTNVSTTAVSTEGFIVADFNGDGKPDVAWNDPSAGNLYVLLGNGDGTFQNPLSTRTNYGQLGGPLPAVGDFNGDGRLDFAIGLNYPDGSGGEVLTFLGNGNGTFQAVSAINAANIRSVTVADFDSDGKPDLALARKTVPQFQSSSLQVLFGNGHGTFTARGNDQTGTTDTALAVAAGNFNPDGRPDIGEIALSTNNVYWWHSFVNSVPRAATATATITVNPSAAGTHELECSYAGDANYQGSASNQVAETYTQLPAPSILLNSPVNSPQTVSIAGAGTSFYTTDGRTPTTNSTKYTAPFVISQTTTVEAISAAFGYVTSNVAEAVFTQASAPVFNPAPGAYSVTQKVRITDATAGVSIFYTLSGATPTAASAQYRGPVAVPANGTLTAIAMAPSLVNSVATSGTYVLLAVAMPAISPPGGAYKGKQTVVITDGSSGSTIHYTTNGATPTASSPTYTGPFTVVGNATIQAMAVRSGYANSGMASAVFTINTTTARLTVTGTDPYAMTCFVEGPGAFSTSGPTGQVVFRDATTATTLGTATLGAAVSGTSFRQVTSRSPATGNYGDGVLPPNQAVSGDVNGDGKLDVVIGIGSTTNAVLIQLGDGDGTFQPLTRILGFDYGALALADVNGDGKLDLLSWGDHGLEVGLGNGDGTFTKLPTQLSPIANLDSIVVADVNGDGKLDIIPQVGQVDLGNGDGTFQAPRNSLIPGTFNAFLGGDFNNDGKLDLAGLNSVDGNVYLFPGNGDGTFKPGMRATVTGTSGPSSWGSLTAADFNRDGHLDLAVGEDKIQGVQILLGNGDGTFRSQTALAINSNGARNLAAADFNHDGIPDLAISPTGPNPLIAFGQGDGRFTVPTSYMSTPAGANAKQVAGNLNPDGRADIVYLSWIPAGSNFTDSLVSLVNSVPRTASASINATVNAGSIATHELRCNYAGDANYQASSSNEVAETYGRLQPPVLAPLTGKYTTAQTVTISGSGTGAVYYYTTDGSTPTTGSTKYTGPLTVSKTTTVKAIAAAPGHVTSDVSEASYTF